MTEALCAGRHRAALLRQHHRPRLAQAAAPSRRASRYRIHTRARRCRRCWRSSSTTRGQDDREAYSTLNMGAGFALFVARATPQRTVDVARAQGIDALHRRPASSRRQAAADRAAGLRFGDDALQLR